MLTTTIIKKFERRHINLHIHRFDIFVSILNCTVATAQGQINAVYIQGQMLVEGQSLGETTRGQRPQVKANYLKAIFRHLYQTLTHDKVR